MGYSQTGRTPAEDCSGSPRNAARGPEGMTNARSIIARLTMALACLCEPTSLFAAGTESSRRAHDLQLSVDSRWAGGANGGYYPIRIRMVNLTRPRALEFIFTDTGG